MQNTIIDIDKLLAPIAGANAAGNYLRYEHEYDEIVEAMKGEDKNLSQGIWIRPLKNYDWNRAKDLCIDALLNKTKDLQLACWLTESLMYLYGFKGLSEGLDLILRLSKSFWDTIHPLPIDGDIELRLAPFEWLSEKLYVQLKLIPIVKTELTAEGYTYYSWEHEVKSIHENHEDESLALKNYMEALVFSTEDFHKEVEVNIAESLQSIKDLKALLREYAGDLSPVFSQLTDTLEMITDLNKTAISYFNSLKKSSDKLEPEILESDIKDKPDTDKSKIDFKFDAVNSVDEAYDSIEQISEFLIENEPEYPTGYLLKQAISFRYMDIKEFLNRRISNKNNLKKIFEILKLS